MDFKHLIKSLLWTARLAVRIF